MGIVGAAPSGMLAVETQCDPPDELRDDPVMPRGTAASTWQFDPFRSVLSVQQCGLDATWSAGSLVAGS